VKYARYSIYKIAESERPPAQPEFPKTNKGKGFHTQTNAASARPTHMYKLVWYTQRKQDSKSKTVAPPHPSIQNGENPKVSQGDVTDINRAYVWYARAQGDRSLFPNIANPVLTPTNPTTKDTILLLLQEQVVYPSNPSQWHRRSEFPISSARKETPAMKVIITP